VQLDWLATHDGPASQADFGRVCAVDASGNVYVGGRSYNPSVGFPPPPPQADFETVKYSPAGSVSWVARRDGFGDEDSMLDIAVAPSGDVYVSGYSWNGTNIDTALIKYSSSGVEQWARFFDGTANSSDFGRSLAFDPSGNVLLGGTSTGSTTLGDLMVLCYSPSGALQWQTIVDGGANGAESGNALAVMSDGTIVLGGSATTASGVDAAVLKLNANGSFAWLRTLDGGSSLADNVFALAVGGSTRIVATGNRTTGTNGEDVFSFELDAATGNVVWSKTFDGPAHGADRGRAAGIGLDGAAWIGGTTTGAGTGIDVVALRYGPSGTQLSAQTWNGATNLDDSVVDLLIGDAGQAWLVGYTTLAAAPLSTDVAVLQFDASGARDWVRTFSTPGAFDDRAFDAKFGPGGKLAIGGYTTGGGTGDYDYLGLQLDLGESPHGYCTAKTTSNGCVPLVTFTGISSASATSGFAVRASQLRNQKTCLLFYGLNGAAATPFQGGTMCVQAPVVRTMLQNSGGSALPVDDCSGSVALDLNAFASGALGGTPAPQLQTVGYTIHCQFWGRDPGFAPPLNTMLSSALRYVVLP
jgi:hypothetical protein